MSELWHEVFEARFGKRFEQREVESWEAEIRHDINSRNTDFPMEITAAVRALAELRRKREFPRIPAVNDIITAIIKARWELSHANEPKSTACALCHDGLVVFSCVYADYPTGPITTVGAMLEDYPHNAAVPCRCKAGDVRMKALLEQDGESEAWLRRVQSAAFRARQTGQPQAVLVEERSAAQ
jgi:hypothetical protein